MFSLIITIIAVALVAALAISTIYYGGSAFSSSSASAAAGGLITQGSQITAAGTLYSVEHTGRGPSSIEALPTQYLRSVPVPPTGAYESGQPSATDWDYYSPGQMHIVIRTKINKKTCLAVNKKNGFIGIPKTLKSDMIVQCYGASEPYTFYYDPSSGTPAQRTQIAQAQGGDGTGYPVSCPDGSSISSGACATSDSDSGSGDSGGGPDSGGALSINPNAIIATVPAGIDSAFTDLITVRNTGSGPAAIGYVDYSGGLVLQSITVATTFLAYNDTCSGNILAPGGLCTFELKVSVTQFASKGVYNASIFVDDADGNALGTLPVTITRQ